MKSSTNIVKKPIRTIFIALSGIMVLLLGLELLVAFELVPAFVLPKPSSVISMFLKEFSTLVTQSLFTLGTSSLGLVIAIFFALLLAFLMDRLSFVHNVLYPLVLASQMIPLVAIAPLFILWFGFNVLPKILIVILVCFFPILLSLLKGFSQTSEKDQAVYELMGASPMDIFLHVKLPGALIAGMAGLRIAVTYCVMGAVIGEWLGGSKGLGVYMVGAQKSYAIEKMFSGIIMVLLMSGLLFGLIVLLEKLFLPWLRQKKEIIK